MMIFVIKKACYKTQIKEYEKLQNEIDFSGIGLKRRDKE